MLDSSTVKLPPIADLARLIEECQSAIDSETFCAAGFSGEGHQSWTSLDLHAQHDGTQAGLRLTNMPYVSGWLTGLNLKILTVRLMRLAAGGRIREHRDAILNGRTVRIHLPVQTNPDAYLVIDGFEHRWRVGEVWAGDFAKLHHGANEGQQDRIHLVVDVEVAPALRALLPPGEAPPRFIQAALASDGTQNAFKTSCFEGRFTLPSDFPVATFGFASSGKPMEGAVQAFGAELWILIENQPLLKANPHSASSLNLEGLGMPALLRYDAMNGTTTTVAIEVGTHRLADLFFTFAPEPVHHH